ncbi:MAG: addiction module toxin RelE [Oceanospirillaceae bacterium]|nr:addiction module toxin RelE [Oceanospirillaceae bacterium]
MRIISRKALREFWENPLYTDSETSLKAWCSEVKSAKWKNTNEVKAQYGKASVICDGRVVFNIHGNKYRLLVRFNFQHQIAFVYFIGTHEQYDDIYCKTYVPPKKPQQGSTK